MEALQIAVQKSYALHSTEAQDMSHTMWAVVLQDPMTLHTTDTYRYICHDRYEPWLAQLFCWEIALRGHFLAPAASLVSYLETK